MRLLSVSAALVLLMLQAGCPTRNVTVAGSVPTPLVERIPASIGIYYSYEFKSFEHKEALPGSGSYRIDLGGQNLDFFRNLLGAMFAEVIEVNQPSVQEGDELDAILIPEIVKYGFLVPSVSTLTFFEASIEYQITVLDRAGQELGKLRIVGYGKAEGSMFGGVDAVGEATMLAIRDGGARIATELSPRIAALLADSEETNGLQP
ncbi:MAG: hypothetical protein P8J55_02715 [Pseudomonadales bacterium]|nr:hypothetical protein [Pseudomonadales bacterium]